MARARNIKPGFFRNADLAELNFDARLLFIGLWTIADREGRLEDKPKQIKMEIFPADNCDVDSMLNQLQSIGVILRYEHGGKRFIQVVNFCKHQNPHKDERASTIQAPCEHGASTVQIGLIPDSLIPETLKPITEEKPSSSEQISDKAKSKFGNEDDHKAARWMFDRIKTILPNAKEPSWDSWANDVRLMRERDGHDHAAICALFEWANKDSFWSSNILSPGKLREKWDQLSVKRGKPSVASRGIHSFENIDYGQSGSL